MTTHDAMRPGRRLALRSAAELRQALGLEP
jgi:hypothetical protein